MTTNAIDDLKAKPMCGCASYGDAVELAIRQYQDIRTLHCNTTYMAVVTVHMIHLHMMLNGNPHAQPALDRITDTLGTDELLAALVERMQAVEELVTLGGKPN